LATLPVAFVQQLARDTADVPRLQQKVLRAREATHVESIDAMTAYTQEVAVVRETAEASIKEAEAQSTLAESEAQERVLKTDAESASSLSFVHGEADELTQKFALWAAVTCLARTRAVV
jgi:prophage DNA circulation protein